MTSKIEPYQDFNLTFHLSDFGHPSEMQYLIDNLERFKADVFGQILEKCCEETTWHDNNFDY